MRTPVDVQNNEHTLLNDSPAFDDALDEEGFFQRFEKTVDNLEVFYRKFLTKLHTTKGIFPDNPKIDELQIRVADLLSIKKCFSGDMDIDNDVVGTEIVRTPTTQRQLSILKTGAVRSGSSLKRVSFSDEVMRKAVKISSVTDGNLFNEPSWNILPTECDIMGRNLEEDFNVHVSREDPYVVRSNLGNYILPRPWREIRPAVVKKSPFIVRPVNVKKSKLSEEERCIYTWIVENTDNSRIVVFECGEVQCINEHIQTLKNRATVIVLVIDAWTCILNEQEKSRAPDSPYRMFCTATITMGTLLNNFLKTKVDCVEEFTKNMDSLCLKYRIDPQKLDMIFFPIHEPPHTYVVCFNLKSLRMEIIDNVRYEVGGSQNYMFDPLFLRDNLVEYMYLKKHNKCEGLNDLLPYQVSLP